MNALGYTISEVVGQHHRMFVEQSYASSSDYQNFWRRLNAGEFISQRVKRIGKGGKVVWIEASYNPIMDESGKPFKVVKYATDIGSNTNTRLLQNVIGDVDKTLTSIAAGDLTRGLGWRL